MDAKPQDLLAQIAAGQDVITVSPSRQTGMIYLTVPAARVHTPPICPRGRAVVLEPAAAQAVIAMLQEAISLLAGLNPHHAPMDGLALAAPEAPAEKVN